RGGLGRGGAAEEPPRRDPPARSLIAARARQAGGAIALLAALAAGACDGDAAALPTPPRRGAFGSLRDLVLFERAGGPGEPFFLDRFEATCEDWLDFAATEAGAAVGAA